MKLSRRLFLLSPLALAYKPSWGALSFPLPQGHFVPAKMPMHPVYPRPDSETQNHARHRWAHPDFRYEIPIGIQGGAWPFKYEIINGPTGATIGQYYGDADYGVLKWTPANGESGTKTFTVRVTDQELNTVDLTWSATIDPARFLFIDSSVTSTGSGTITSPLKSVSDWYGAGRSDSTFVGRIVVFRAGIYYPTPIASEDPYLILDSNYKTECLIGYPDEYPVIDCSGAAFDIAPGSLGDIYIGSLIFKNARTSVGNPYFFRVSGGLDRGAWYDVTFDTLQLGTSNSNNTAAIFTIGGTNQRENFLFKKLKFTNFNATGPNGGYLDLYYLNHVVIEECEVTNSNTSFGFWLKGTRSFVTFRNNTLIDNISGRALTIQYGAEAGGVTHDHEVCWNNIRGNSPSQMLANIVQNSTYAGQHYNTSIYRNTVAQGWASLRNAGSEPYNTAGNIILGAHPESWDTSIATGLPADLVSTDQSIVDAQNMLSSNFRNNYLGIMGCEVFNGNITQPKPAHSLSIQ